MTSGVTMSFSPPEPGGTWQHLQQQQQQQRGRVHTFGDSAYPVFVPGHSCYTPCACAQRSRNRASVDGSRRPTMPSLPSPPRGQNDLASPPSRSYRTMTRATHGLPTPSPDRSDASSRSITPAPSPPPTHKLPSPSVDTTPLMASLTEVRRSWDVAGRTCQWDLSRFELVLGYAPEHVSPSLAWWQDRIHPDDRARVLASLQSFVESRELRFWTDRYRILASDDKYISVIDQLRALERDPRSGVALRCLGILSSSEQTEQAQALFPSATLEPSDESGLRLIKDVAENSASGFVVLDGAGCPTYMNAAAEALTGWTLAELRRRPLPCVHSSSEACSLAGARAAIRDVPHVLAHRAGPRVPVVCAVTPLRAGGGAVLELREVAGAAEEQARLCESEAGRTRMEESEANRVRLGQYVDFVAHEIRNPLHGIAASTEFLADAVARLEPPTHGPSLYASTPDPVHNESMRSALADVHDYIRSIRECCAHQATITNNVLDLSRLESGKVELLSDVFDPAEVASTCLAMLAAPIAEKGISANLELPAVPFVVRGDRMRYSQVVMNLTGNAVKFTDPGKAVTIVVSAPEPPASGDEASQARFHTTVCDTGIGMTPAEISSLFTRFGQLGKHITRDYGGSGLGLNISNELVHLLGGAFHVSSEKGVGTQMRFSVAMGSVPPAEAALWLAQQHAHTPAAPAVVEEPLVASPAAEVTERSSSPKSLDEGPMGTHALEGTRSEETGSSSTSSSSSLATPPPPHAKFSHVLIAEDNLINQMVLSTYLKKLGYTYSACANGREAVDFFAAERIDAVIMDMEMPILDGREATRLIRAHEGKQDGRTAPPACIIALSGNARPGLMQDAYDTGLNDYLTKPCSMDELARMLRKWEHDRAREAEG